jgi:hypothetical protein
MWGKMQDKLLKLACIYQLEQLVIFVIREQVQNSLLPGSPI